MRLIKSKRWEVQVAYMGEISNKYKFRVENLKDINHFVEAGKSVKDLKTKGEIKLNDSLNSGYESDGILRLK